MEEEHHIITNAQASGRIWITTWMVIVAASAVVLVFIGERDAIATFLIFAIAAMVAGVPALIILTLLAESVIDKRNGYKKNLFLIHGLLFLVAFLYGLVTYWMFHSPFATWQENLYGPAGFTGCLYAASALGMLLNTNFLRRYLKYDGQLVDYTKLFTQFFSIIKIQTMFTDETPAAPQAPANPNNKLLIKGIITAVLILVMLIPTAFIQNLITERQDRQKAVVEEVSSKWAEPQTLSAPYLVIPYYDGPNDKDKKMLAILPDQLNVAGNITEEDRTRSIYKVILYKTGLKFSGSFKNTAHDSTVLLLNEAKLCFGLSDFRGIEDKLTVTLNNNPYTLLPGLPATIVDSSGLSVPVTINAGDLEKGISFNMDVALKGSGSLHFLPLGSYSTYNIRSSWPNPSFDGNTLPATHNINDTGFLATWKFNAANLPFTSVVKNTHLDAKQTAFGVSLVQPAGQYEKTMRSAKYAILIIGLTFVLFFIFEMMQKKPVHPLQYVLTGMALVIFYTLLLSISEIIEFAYAYTIAAIATIMLIALYAKSHFNNWRAAITIGLLLTGLYGFIYVLISLEDTALLVGSIALFIVVAVIMYVTRKVNWYQPASPATINFQP